MTLKHIHKNGLIVFKLKKITMKKQTKLKIKILNEAIKLA